MKLNHDCIRDLLLYLEDNLSLSDEIIANNLELKDYSSDEIIYTADKLYEANFLNCIKTSSDDEPFLMITSISYQGHQFLDNIRDDNIWKNSKQVLSKFKSTSITFISDVASQIISNIISKNIGIN